MACRAWALRWVVKIGDMAQKFRVQSYDHLFTSDFAGRMDQVEWEIKEIVGELVNKVGETERTEGGVTRAKLDVEIPRLYTMDPNGPRLFGEDIMKLIKNNVSSGVPYSNCRVGIMLESDETSESVLELDNPKVATYLNPPSGSRRKRKFDMASLLDLMAFGKKSKTVKEKGEKEAANDLFDSAAEKEETEETEEEDVIKPQRSNIMNVIICYNKCLGWGPQPAYCYPNNNANAYNNPDPKTSPPVTTTMSLETTEFLTITSTTGSNTKTIIVTCCIIGVVILLCIGIALFYFRRKKASSGTKDINSVESNSKGKKKNEKDAQFARY
ncbi:hypothetical protein CRE_02800 [Caenorhabditis remanei]|uniref:Uncharacterized protein n=1 Tax=Caenorhabditis remanei TaxID=31234 RepID=E3LX09_CAERE|nr:hypothetical protein CRE_02800 [Caenorhabditis remanei]